MVQLQMTSVALASVVIFVIITLIINYVHTSAPMCLGASSKTARTEETLHLRHEQAPSPNITIYGHVHMAKTGGTSINGIFANKFERVCGHKGYSFDAYSDNERAKRDKNAKPPRIVLPRMVEIGFEDCDYVSMEGSWTDWNTNFANDTFHGVSVELHVPCRERIDHLMSQFNYFQLTLDCDASSDEVFFEGFASALRHVKERYNHRLHENFDVKCVDFKKQFTTYTHYMTDRLQTKRFESHPYIKRNTNLDRNKTNECIWRRQDILEKVNVYLLENFQYYRFCDTCMGSENEITRDKIE